MKRSGEDPTLWDEEPVTPGRRRRGRAERAVDAAVRTARTRGQLDDLDGALVALARVAARALDAAEARVEEDPKYLYAVPGLSREHRETLAALGLGGRGSYDSADAAVDAFLASLSDSPVSD